MLTAKPLSSGDLVADRRLEHARGYAAAGEPAAAAELTEQALEIVPAWAAGWFELAGFHEAAGHRDAAIAAYERALALDAADACGAGLRLARLGARPTPAAPPPAHVAGLFDGYAARFEEALVGRLGYRAPAVLAAAIAAVAPGRRFRHGLDLGCGTGLMAEALAGSVDRLDGVDLSAAMIAVAARKGLYATLEVGDVTAALAARPPAALDLVIAADVFCYLGDLAPVVAAAARAAAPGAIFAFTVERWDGGDAMELHLGDSLRYAHTRSHLERVTTAAGFAPLHLEETVLRRDRDADVGGLVAVFTKT